MPNLNNLTTQDLQWGTANWSGQGYIDGLKMAWNSATSISVTSGSAFIPSLSKCLPNPSTLTLSGLTLTPSTWYHVYLYSNAGTPAIECVTTAPAAAYNGTARTKTGDTSRRYLGSVLTDASGNIFSFKIFDRHVLYTTFTGGAPFRVLTNGAAIATTNVSCAGCIPVTSELADLVIFNSDSTLSMIIGDPDGSNNMLGLPGNPGTRLFAPQSLDSLQRFNYSYQGGTPASGLYVDVHGYTYER
jgi:hypothetical protein